MRTVGRTVGVATAVLAIAILCRLVGQVVVERRHDPHYRIKGPVAGWDVLTQSVVLTGRILGGKYYENDTIFTPDEHDWNIYLHPDEPNWLSHNGYANEAPGPGLIELEAEPIPPMNTEPEFRNYFSKFINRPVTVCGAWVNDDSHGDKTEIHPMSAILDKYDTGVRVVAMTERSGNRGLLPLHIWVPFREQPWIVRFSISHPDFVRVTEQHTVAIGGASSRCSDNPDGEGSRLFKCEIDTAEGFFFSDYAFSTMEGWLPPGCPAYCLANPCSMVCAGRCCTPVTIPMGRLDVACGLK